MAHVAIENSEKAESVSSIALSDKNQDQNKFKRQ